MEVRFATHREILAIVAVDVVLLETIRSTRQKLVADGPHWLRSEDDFGRISVPMSDGDVLRDLLAVDRVRSVLEVGLGYGTSALAIAEALVCAEADDIVHWIVDPYQAAFG